MELASIYTQIWDRLTAAATEPSDAARVLALASRNPDGVQVRMLVLRECHRESALLRLYSDRRAPKVAQLQADPRVSVLLYEEGRQLRLQARARVHLAGPVFDQCWARCSLSARRAYMAASAPGSPLGAPGSALPNGLDTRAPSLDQSESGRINFAVIELDVQQIDYLHLDPHGHRRAQFQIDNERAVKSVWCVP